jgi:isopenicillin N synthase-like dioxygenase
MKKVPTVDLREYVAGSEKEKTSFTLRFGEALQQFGFVIVEGHGVDSKVISKSYENVKSFFALSVADKLKYVSSDGGQRGYTGFGTEHAKDSKLPDLKEFWHVGRSEYSNLNEVRYPENLWPEKSLAPSFKETLLSLWSQLDVMAVKLLSSLSEYLLLEKDTLPRMIENGNSILRCLHYPSVQEEHFHSGAVRAAAHEDINFITILCEATESGLEILTREGDWMSIETSEGQMVVDSGDMLSRICNNVIPSTTHRVVNPPGSSNAPRFSMPYFVHPHSQCKLNVLDTCRSVSRPPGFSPILADAFLRQRLVEIGLSKK